MSGTALEYRNGCGICPKCRKYLYNAAGCPCGWKANTLRLAAERAAAHG